MLAFLLALGCMRPPADDSASPVEPGRLELPDLTGKSVVYVHTDTLRSDRLQPYGYARDTTPRMASEPWLLVDGIYGSSSWTVPSTGSLLSAEPPEIHGMTNRDGDAATAYIEIYVPTVTEHLQAQGWATGLFAGNVWVAEQSDLWKGFDVVEHLPKTTERYNLQEHNERAFAWLDTLPEGQPFFLFLQPLDMHTPYWVAPEDRGYYTGGDPPFDLDETDSTEQMAQITSALQRDTETATAALNDVYDEQLRGLDRGVGELLDGLDARGLLDDVLFVFAADHGETLNDVGDRTWGHARWLNEELVHTPLLLRLPDGTAGSVDCIAPNQDLFPTFLEALGVPPMEGVSGRSLREGCDDMAVSTLYADRTTLESVNVSDGRNRVTRDCAEGTQRGWDLVDDPEERRPVDPSELRRGAELVARIDEVVASVTAVYPDTICP